MLSQWKLPAAHTNFLKEAGLRFFVHFLTRIRQREDVDPSPIIAQLIAALSQVEALYLFREWSPPRFPPCKAIELDKSQAYATSVAGSGNFAADQAVMEEGYWCSEPQQNETHWGIKLPREERICCIEIEWMTDASSSFMPKSYSVEVCTEDTEWKAVANADGDSVEDYIVHRFAVLQGSNLRVVQSGFHRSNLSQQHGIKHVKIYTEQSEAKFTAPKQLLSLLDEWTLSTAFLRSSDLNWNSVLASVLLLRSSGSLCSLLRLSSKFLKAEAPVEVPIKEALNEVGSFIQNLIFSEHTASLLQEQQAASSKDAGGISALEGMASTNPDPFHPHKCFWFSFIRPREQQPQVALFRWESGRS